MKEMNIKFSWNDVGINPSEIVNNPELDIQFIKMFSGKIDYNHVLRIDKFIEILEKNKWRIPKVNLGFGKYTNYIFESKKRLFRKPRFRLELLFPKEYSRDEYRKNYDNAQKKLAKLSKKAKRVGSNVLKMSDYPNEESVDIRDNDVYNFQTKLIVNNDKNYKGTKYMPTIRKFFKDKPKLAIALITLTAAATAIGFGVYAVNELIETQKYLDQNSQYSYQNDQSSDTINQQKQLYQAIQNGEVDDSLTNPNEYIEEMKMDYNAENYQGEQNNQRIR